MRTNVRMIATAFMITSSTMIVGGLIGYALRPDQAGPAKVAVVPPAPVAKARWLGDPGQDCAAGWGVTVIGQWTDGDQTRYDAVSGRTLWLAGGPTTRAVPVFGCTRQVP